LIDPANKVKSKWTGSGDWADRDGRRKFGSIRFRFFCSPKKKTWKCCRDRIVSVSNPTSRPMIFASSSPLWPFYAFKCTWDVTDKIDEPRAFNVCSATRVTRRKLRPVYRRRRRRRRRDVRRKKIDAFRCTNERPSDFFPPKLESRK
jgi:hypothetical protein